MGTITLVGIVQANADSATGWANGGLESELSYQGSSSYGAKVGSGTTRFPHTGTTRNFSTGGANEGDHILVILGSLTPGKLDTKANGGLGILAGNDGTNFGEWYVDGSDTKSPTTLFLPYIIDPAADFDNTLGSFTLSGNPGQLNAAYYFGGRFDATSGIMGNFNNGLVDQITIGSGLRGTGTGGTLAEWITADEGTVGNRYGYLTTREGVVYFQGKMYFGSSVSSYAFSDTDKVIIFPDAPVAADYFEIRVENAASNVVFDGFTIQAPGTPKVALTHVSGVWNIANSTIDGARQIAGGTGMSIDGSKITNSGQITIGSGTLTNSSVLNSTSAVAVELSASSIFNNCTISGADRALKFPNGAGPFTLDGVVLNGNTVDIQVNSASDVVVNTVNGAGASTIENIGAGNASIQSAVPITLTGIVPGSRVHIRDQTNNVDLFNTIEPTAAFSNSVNYAGDVTLRIRVRNASASPKYKALEVTESLTAAGLSRSINQVLDE